MSTLRAYLTMLIIMFFSGICSGDEVSVDADLLIVRSVLDQFDKISLSTLPDFLPGELV